MHTSNSTAGKYFNPGYEHLKSIYFLKKAQAKDPLAVSSTYILPLMALQSARMAIEEYINLTGRKVDPILGEIDWTSMHIQDRIAYIYRKVEKTLNFHTGIWKDVLALFETEKLINENLSETEKLQKDEIPEKFKNIAVRYPINRSQAVAEGAADILLDLPGF